MTDESADDLTLVRQRIANGIWIVEAPEREEVEWRVRVRSAFCVRRQLDDVLPHAHRRRLRRGAKRACQRESQQSDRGQSHAAILG